MLTKDFLDHSMTKPYWGIIYDLNFLLGRYAYLESTEELMKCIEIIEDFYSVFGEKLGPVIKEYIDEAFVYIDMNTDTDEYLNREYCGECENSCCELRNTAFFTFGDLVRIRQFTGPFGYPDLLDHEKRLDEPCLFLDGGCVFDRKTRPLMCLNSICTEWGIIEPDFIFDDIKGGAIYKLNGERAYVYQREAARIILEKTYEVRLK